MSIIARKLRACPYRSASDTWKAITSLLRPDASAAIELSKIDGIAASVIAEELLASSPIIVSGSGPQVRLYCLYGEDALEDGQNEDPLTHQAATGTWTLALPCSKEDEAWIAAELAVHGGRFSCYVSEANAKSAALSNQEEVSPPQVDWKEFQKA